MLKARLIEPPVLGLARSLGDSAVDNNAHDNKIGSVLLQREPDEIYKSPRYWSCRLNHAERAYDTTNIKCSSVAWAILLLQPYLEGCLFTIRTYHCVMKCIFIITDSTAELSHCPLKFSEFNFDLMHRAGTKNQAAYVFLKLRTTRTDRTSIDDDILPPSSAYPNQNWRGEIHEYSRWWPRMRKVRCQTTWNILVSDGKRSI